MQRAGFERELPRMMEAAKVPGLAVALIENGRIVSTRAYGMADQERGIALRTDSIMYGASLTKAAFAHLVLQLVDEGVIDLDAPLPRQLRQPLPDYPQYADLRADPRWQQITPRMLLSHTAGFPNFRWINDDKKLDIKFAPGSRYVYSGEGINLLQLVVEERTGQPLARLMQARVFDRFGMKDSAMTWRSEWEGRAVVHYDENGKPLAHQKRGHARAAGSMDTTLEDAARFLAAVLRGEGLKRESARQMVSAQLAIVSPTQFPSHWPGQTDAFKPIALSIGLGWPVFESPKGKVFFKEGHDDGTNNLMLGLASQRSGIVMLSNSSNAERMFAPAVRTLFGELCLPWYWMSYVPWDVTLAENARTQPPVTEGCGGPKP